MSAKKRILRVIAKKYEQDPDVVLIILWDIDENRFDYLKNEHSIIRKKDLRFIEEVIVSKTNEEYIIKNKKRNEPKKVSYLDYDFSLIGKVVSPILYLSKEEVLKIYEELVMDFKDFKDPIYPFGLKNEHLLDSALFHSKTSYLGKIKYPTVESSGAALMYSISNNHAFHNGNKRAAIVSLLVFLDRHNFCLSCDENELFKLSIKVADHKLVDENTSRGDSEIYELARWIRNNSKRLVKMGERPVTLKKLRQILIHFGCSILDNGQIERIKKSKSIFFGIVTKRRLLSRKHIANSISEGDEIDKGLIKSIREDLELDSDNGIDSESFYAMTNFSSSEFIIKYKNLLTRLSKI
jgi:death-on-curing family protein